MKENEAKYLLVLPESMLHRVRELSLLRKKEKAENRTQKAILLEALMVGLESLYPQPTIRSSD